MSLDVVDSDAPLRKRPRRGLDPTDVLLPDDERTTHTPTSATSRRSNASTPLSDDSILMPLADDSECRMVDGDEIDLTHSQPNDDDGVESDSAPPMVWAPCPVCDRTFPKHRLQRHTASCFDDMARSAQVEDRAPSASSASAKKSNAIAAAATSPATAAASSSRGDIPILSLSPSPSPEVVVVSSPLRDRSHVTARKPTAASRRAGQANEHLAPPPPASTAPPSAAATSASSPGTADHDSTKDADTDVDVEMLDAPAAAASPATSSSRRSIFSPRHLVSPATSTGRGSPDSATVPASAAAAAAAAAAGCSAGSAASSSSSSGVVGVSESAVSVAAESSQENFERIMSQLEYLVDLARSECFCTIHLDLDGAAAARSSSPAKADAAAALSSHVQRSGSSAVNLITALTTGLHQLSSAYRASLSSFSLHTSRLRSQLDAQSAEFLQVRLEMERSASGKQHETDEQLSRIRIEEMVAREAEAEKLREAQLAKETQWLTERLKVEAEKAEEISKLKNQAAEVANKLEMLSTNSAAALMDGEAKAIETGEGDLKRIALFPSEHFGGHTPEEFHFRLAESQFLRMVGALGSYHVSQVEYILNPPLLKRYHDFKKALQAKGEPVHERLTFHGTSAAAIEAIVREGFRIGGVDTAVLAGTALGTGVYSSESPAFAMGYIKDGRTSLLFSRVCPSRDSVVAKDPSGVIQQLVCKHREQIIPVYIVHYAAGARPAKGAKAKATKAAAAAMSMLGGALGTFGGLFAGGSTAVPIASKGGPIILAGSPLAAGMPPMAMASYRRGGRPKASKPSRKRGRVAPAAMIMPPPAAAGASGDDDDQDEEEAREYAMAIKASLAAS